MCQNLQYQTCQIVSGLFYLITPWQYLFTTIKILKGKKGGVTGFLGSLKICLCEERRLKDTQNLKCEDRRFQNCLVLKTEDLATKPTKPEDWRFEFLTGKIWLLSVINWEDGSWWYLPPVIIHFVLASSNDVKIYWLPSMRMYNQKIQYTFIYTILYWKLASPVQENL